MPWSKMRLDAALYFRTLFHEDTAFPKEPLLDTALSAPPYEIINMRAFTMHIHRIKPGFSYRPAVDFYAPRSALVTHFQYQYKRGDLRWPRNMSSMQSSTCAGPRFIVGLKTNCWVHALYHKPSSLVTRYVIALAKDYCLTLVTSLVALYIWRIDNYR